MVPYIPQFHKFKMTSFYTRFTKKIPYEYKM